jgi:hypothetical protein
MSALTTPIRSRHNQYHGINAHLHSFWQEVGGWSRFHSLHIGHLTLALKEVLLPMGYTAENEPSLQIRRVDDIEPNRYPEADVSIYDLDSQRMRLPQAPTPTQVGELVLPLIDSVLTRVSQKRYESIAIYELLPNRVDRGEAIVWLELLSPSNKPKGTDSDSYWAKRQRIIESGMVFVELDYLHESPSTIPHLADYTRQQDGSHPYRIAIMEPRPTLDEGKTRIQGFDVDMPIPTSHIPLNASDILSFDFNQPYQKTFYEAFYGIERVDYSQLPLNFSSYSTLDQTRIARRMLAILEAHHAGVSFIQEPLPLSTLSLETLLERIYQLNQA